MISRGQKASGRLRRAASQKRRTVRSVPRPSGEGRASDRSFWRAFVLLTLFVSIGLFLTARLLSRSTPEDSSGLSFSGMRMRDVLMLPDTGQFHVFDEKGENEVRHAGGSFVPVPLDDSEVDVAGPAFLVSRRHNPDPAIVLVPRARSAIADMWSRSTDREIRRTRGTVVLRLLDTDGNWRRVSLRRQESRHR